MPELAAVTGAFSYTGAAIAERLLADGLRVRTLSRRNDPSSPLHRRIEVAPLQFADEPALVESLRGAQTLYNTYWIRFERGGSTFERAVANTRTLFRAARSAGVERVVHLSVSNPSADSPLPYFRGKAQCEQALAESGLEHTIVRPTLVFGPRDILVNNIAWILRRFPLFLVPGSGRYRVQPVSVEDVAEIAVTASGTVDAAGPEVLSFDELVRAVGAAIGRRRTLVHVRPGAALGLGGLVGAACRDVLLTRDEVAGLQAELLVSQAPPLGTKSFRDWLASHGGDLGRRYVSELARNFRPYAPL
ncbi:MAG TPA: NAD-dependent epimerase/dehydratase family protein [Gaiellaceae bacterium]